MAKNYLTTAQVLLSQMLESELSPSEVAQTLVNRERAKTFISSFLQDSFETGDVSLTNGAAVAICDSMLSWTSDVADAGGGEQMEDYLSLQQRISDILVRQFGADSKELSDVQPL